MSVREKYNQTASIYNQRYRTIQREKYKIMLSDLELKGKILDHGCGTGLLSQFLNRDLIGVDSSKEMLKIRCSGAPGRAPGGTSPVASLLRPKMELIGVDSSKEMLKIRGSGDLADVEELPYRDAEFDFVLSFTTLQNCKNPEKAIKEVKRVLRPKGTFVCTFLRSFEKKLEPLLKKHFKISERKDCGEDVGFIFFPTFS